jgi:hypothetical protein
MEIQTTNQNLEQVLPECKLLRIGNPLAEQLMLASKGQTLRVSDENDLKQVLRYSMLLVGLRANNMPTEEEKFVLINFIKTNFANVTIAQIKLAFDMAVAGKLQVDAKCYENFSCEFFGRIMSSYLQFSAEETRIISQRVVEDEPLPKPSDEVLKLQAIEIINDFADKLKESKDTGKKFTWIAGGLSELYKMLVSFGIQTISKEEMLEIWRKSARIENEEERKNYCRMQSYILLANQLADFDARINSEGQIKPIEE